MTKKNKLIERLLTKPKDFTWSELTKLLNGLDYKLISTGKTGGSRIRFIREDYPPIVMHKPHPKPILKPYQLEYVIQLLSGEKLI
jgi:hypothetical protein